MPIISVVVLTYNNEQYIERCINSILNGTFKDLELVVVNNGSTDNTEPLIRQMMDQDSRITYVPLEKNKGIFAGRLEGMKAATGQYIGFSDSDDFYEPNAFEVLYNASQKYQADIVTAHTVENKNNHSTINNTFSFSMHENKGVLKSYLDNKPYSNLWCALFHRKLVEQALPYYPKDLHILGGEDYIHSVFLHFFATKKVQITDAIYHWRKNFESVSMAFGKKASTKVLEDYQAVYLTVENFLREQNYYEIFSRAWERFLKKQFMPLYSSSKSFNRKIILEWAKKADPKFLIQLILILKNRGRYPFIHNLGMLPLHKQIIVCTKHIIKQTLKKIGYDLDQRQKKRNF